jgi:hypothetical protein
MRRHVLSVCVHACTPVYLQGRYIKHAATVHHSAAGLLQSVANLAAFVMSIDTLLSQHKNYIFCPAAWLDANMCLQGLPGADGHCSLVHKDLALWLK